MRAALGRAVATWVERIGETVPIRPRHVHYPDPPRALDALVIKALLALVLGVGGGGFVASALVARTMHGAPVLGAPLAPGVYFPTDILGWERFERRPLAHSDALALARAGLDPGAARAAFVPAHRAVALGVLAGLLGALLLAHRRPRMPRALAALRGDAEWASYRDVRRADLLWRPGKAGVYLGAFERPKLCGIIPRAPVPLVYGGPRHVLQQAASRSGKDVGSNRGTALSWPHSMIDNDPKGEAHLQTSGIREALFGNEIVRFAPGAGVAGECIRDAAGNERVERFGSTRWNPLEEVALGTDFEFSELLQVITMIVDPTGRQLDGENSHWYKTARVVIKALCLKVLYDPLEPTKSVGRVADLFGGSLVRSAAHAALHRDTDGAPPRSIEELLEQYLGFRASGFGPRPSWLVRSVEQLRLGAEREILLARKRIGVSADALEVERFEAERRQQLDAEIARVEREMRHPDLERDLRNTLRIRGEEASSVYSTVNANLTPWLDPLVMRNTAGCDAHITDIVNRERPVTWYNVSPIDRADMLRPIIKLWYTMALRKLVPDMDVDRASKRTLSPWRHPLLWLMNERGALGPVEIENEVLPVAASYSFLFDYLFQTPQQIKEVGGEHEVITANCGIQVLHTPQAPEDQEALSKRLGQRTVLVENLSFSRSGRTRAWHPEAMPLLTPQQVAQIPTEPRFRVGADGQPARGEHGVLEVVEPAYQVIFAPDCRPIYARKTQWFTNPRMARLIATIPAVVPRPLHASSAQAEEHALREQVRATAHRPDAYYRRTARVAETIALHRLDPVAAPAGGSRTAEAPSPSPSPSPLPEQARPRHRLVAARAGKGRGR